MTTIPGPWAKNIPRMSFMSGSYPDNPIFVWSSNLFSSIIRLQLAVQCLWQLTGTSEHCSRCQVRARGRWVAAPPTLVATVMMETIFFSNFWGDYYTAQGDNDHNDDDNDASSRPIIATLTTSMLNMIYDIIMMSYDMTHIIWHHDVTHIRWHHDDVELPWSKDDGSLVSDHQDWRRVCAENYNHCDCCDQVNHCEQHRIAVTIVGLLWLL